MIKFLLFLIYLTISTSKVYATEIAVIDINYLINNSVHFIEITKEINKSQIEYKEKFTEIETNLFKKKQELEDSKIILNEEEFNIKKNEYYEEVSTFESNIANFNNHFENEITKIKNVIYSKILEFIQVYASENQIELILEKNQYLIASEELNISDIIFSKLNSIELDIKFNKYED